MPFDELPSAICLLIFVIIFALIVKAGKAFGFELSEDSSFAVLTLLLSAGLACATFTVARRALFGKRPTRPPAGWLRLIIAIGTVLALALAIADGIDARRREAARPPPPPTPVQNDQVDRKFGFAAASRALEDMKSKRAIAQ